MGDSSLTTVIIITTLDVYDDDNISGDIDDGSDRRGAVSG